MRAYLVGSLVLVLLVVAAIAAVAGAPHGSEPDSGMGAAMLVFLLLGVLAVAYLQALVGSLVLWRLRKVPGAKRFFFGYAGVACGVALVLAAGALLE